MYRATDPEVQKNPQLFFAWLRREAPVYRDPDFGAFFITRDEDIRRVAMDPTTFSSVINPAVFRVVQGLLEESDPEVAERLKSRGWLVPTTLLLTDPPAHTRYRRLVQEALNPKSVAELTPHIRARVLEILDGLPREGEVEFVSAFAQRLPIYMVGRFIFGAPESDHPRINAWADQFFLTLMPAASREEYLKTVDAIIAMHHYIKARIDVLRERAEDHVLLSRLLRIHEQTGDEPLSEPELMSMMQVFLIAGHDTTRQTLANALQVLASYAEIQQRVRADKTLLPQFINEVLRLYAAAAVTPRIAACDTQLHGVAIPKGSMIFMAWGSANRDEGVHPDPDRFDLDRPDAKSHLSFGWGIHHCVGAHLARAQLSIALGEILGRYRGIELAVPGNELEYVPNMNSRALVRLPLNLRA